MIVGFSINSLDAEKTAGKRGSNIGYSSSITEIEEADVPAIDDKIARISFEMGIKYQDEDENDVAHLDFTGTVLWQDDAEDLIAQWEDEEDVPSAVGQAVTNHVFRKCLTQAVSLSDALELQSPVPMPRIAQQQQN